MQVDLVISNGEISRTHPQLLVESSTDSAAVSDSIYQAHVSVWRSQEVPVPVREVETT